MYATDNNLRASKLISSDAVVAAMKKVDRANYVRIKSAAYEDSPQSIGYSATISAPHMHAHATENLLDYLKPGSKVLDVGSGSGYSCAVFHHLVGPTGKVVGVDHIDKLVELSEYNLKNDGLSDMLDSGAIKMVTGDGRQGYADSGPYDAIHVGAAAPSMPTALVQQLAQPGRMFVPVEKKSGNGQSIWQVDKDDNGALHYEELISVMYVPLTDRKQQIDF
ncbi:protein-L-isoaspartate O-methyltransferase [Wallemia mellicola]|nr:protein-L-isoaspartate O-methyltransferase [Wallemia mellicola]TIC30350.1 protein-L-isoaspartate O-methyltransferase [Wallemia mellicola]TIC75711.1 protein-L-isoaspartate O-methyltransferase [Wallemia mellicola]